MQDSNEIRKEILTRLAGILAPSLSRIRLEDPAPRGKRNKRTRQTKTGGKKEKGR